MMKRSLALNITKTWHATPAQSDCVSRQRKSGPSGPLNKDHVDPNLKADPRRVGGLLHAIGLLYDRGKSHHKPTISNQAFLPCM